MKYMNVQMKILGAEKGHEGLYDLPDATTAIPQAKYTTNATGDNNTS